MKNNDFFNFIVPRFEPLQLGFFILILVMFFGTIISARLNAKEASWVKNWNNDTPDDDSDDLDIDHGSVTDLCHAVATKSEKLAEIMPGMLLVVGLLGTFIGLGLALNNASNILGQSNALSAAGAANSIQEMMGMMQGLGAKFKTSTWGIIFFLLLKAWSSWHGFEEKRLNWVIRKVKVELEYRKKKEQDTEFKRQQALFAQIEQASGRIVQGFSINLEQLLNGQKDLQLKSFQYLEKWSEAIQGDLEKINTTIQINRSAMQRESSALKQVLCESTQGVREDLVNLKLAMQYDGAAMKQALEQNIQGIREDLGNLNVSMGRDSSVLRQVLEQSTQGVREDLASINTATQTSSQAMVDFVSSTHSIIKDMSAASSTMADGAHKVAVAGSSLVKAVDEFSTQFTKVLDDVRTDLSKAINDMSEQAAKTLEQGTTELGKATLEISTALGVLSQDVTTTMNGVKDSIEKSLKIQQEGAVLFRRSSDTLNENVTATTELVQKLGEDIRSGLQAVSDSGRRMASIGKSLETVVSQIGDLLPSLEPLKTLSNQHELLLDEAKSIRKDFLKLDSRQQSEFEKSLKIQHEGTLLFQHLSDTLNKNVTVTTELVQQLGEDIRSGLQEVSNSALQMSSIGKMLEAFTFETHDLRKEVVALPVVESLIKSNADVKS